MVGSGARLFRDGGPIKALQLAKLKITPDGVAILTYGGENKTTIN